MYACTVAAVVLNSIRTARKSDIWPVRHTPSCPCLYILCLSPSPCFPPSPLSLELLHASAGFCSAVSRDTRAHCSIAPLSCSAHCNIWSTGAAQLGVRSRRDLRGRIPLSLAARGALLPDRLARAADQRAVDPTPQLARSVSSHIFGAAPLWWRVCGQLLMWSVCVRARVCVFVYECGVCVCVSLSVCVSPLTVDTLRCRLGRMCFW